MALQKQQIEPLYQKLLMMKKEIEERSSNDSELDESLRESTGEIAGGIDNHLGDSATELFDRERERTIDEADEERLGEINDALKRIEEGTYGICVDTGEDIPIERLEALPYAKRTIKAQEQFEQQKNGGLSAEEKYEQNMRKLADGDTVGAKTLTTDALRREHDAF